MQLALKKEIACTVDGEDKKHLNCFNSLERGKLIFFPADEMPL